MILDPVQRGRVLADFYLAVAPRLYADLDEAGVLPSSATTGALPQAQLEWDCFALYACVRGLVAAGGFNRETAAAIDAMHAHVLGAWMAAAPSVESFELRRTRIAERYHEYGEIGQRDGKAGAATLVLRLGEAAARHIAAPDAPPEGLVELAGVMHETMAEGAAEAVRSAAEA